MKKFGLIGKTLKHSFSKKYFGEKFDREGIENCEYELYELPDIAHFPDLIKNLSPDLVGLNVTIPYKLEVMQYLDEMDEHATAIQAVNTIKVSADGKLTGYNSDYYGFKDSLMEWELAGKSALVLGTGGASKAIVKALEDLSIPYQMVSRRSSDKTISYDQINENPDFIADNLLIINTTPLGTYPNVEEKPDLPYDQLSADHLLFDLVYNPELTAFMQEGINAGAKTKNGYAMLVGQAEKSWAIWNDKDE
ncbi:shikimate dehydrogenase [Reichenbachiella sp. ABR2-5]|uniref:Shikimate dehydrogenase n=2 Tax=Reichenbachiella ulvae TaxID=2980104 RepID=A0ABT3CP50_9BACT|nr:shikimate dehydrogenase [Reichenbachiella ulvae]